MEEWKVDDASPGIADALKTASEAFDNARASYADASTALSSARSAYEKAKEVGGIADYAKSRAEGAFKSASDALGSAKSAYDRASTAMTNAQTSLTNGLKALSESAKAFGASFTVVRDAVQGVVKELDAYAAEYNGNFTNFTEFIKGLAAFMDNVMNPPKSAIGVIDVLGFFNKAFASAKVIFANGSNALNSFCRLFSKGFSVMDSIKNTFTAVGKSFETASESFGGTKVVLPEIVRDAAVSNSFDLSAYSAVTFTNVVGRSVFVQMKYGFADDVMFSVQASSGVVTKLVKTQEQGTATSVAVMTITGSNFGTIRMTGFQAFVVQAAAGVSSIKFSRLGAKSS
ncbi:MAG: hypothetical protein M0R66_03920 [Candidatus Omnitrophica bacterium]|nr:hypothetical protein [Candidatus Omnitrophota bacterium]